MRRFLCILFAIALPADAETLVATRTLQANTVLMASDMRVLSEDQNVVRETLATAVGMETLNVIFKGQAIPAHAIAAPALVERNQVVLLVFNRGGLSIETEGRALDRGRAGDVVRVMNLASRSTVSGVVDPLGAIQVGNKK